MSPTIVQVSGNDRLVARMQGFGTTIQPAIARALAKRPPRHDPIRARLQDQRDRLCDGLVAQGFDVVRPQGTYFATVDVHRDAVEFCRDLPQGRGRCRHPQQCLLQHGGRRLLRPPGVLQAPRGHRRGAGPAEGIGTVTTVRDLLEPA